MFEIIILFVVMSLTLVIGAILYSELDDRDDDDDETSY